MFFTLSTTTNANDMPLVSVFLLILSKRYRIMYLRCPEAKNYIYDAKRCPEITKEMLNQNDFIGDNRPQ